jgi:hypothetical protein
LAFLFSAMCMIFKTTFSWLCFLITIALSFSAHDAKCALGIGSLVSGFATGGSSGALSSLTGGGAYSSGGMIDEYGLDASTGSQQAFSALAPGDIPLMSAAEADLYNSLAASAAGTAVAPMSGGSYQDFGSISPAMPSTGYAASYPSDPASSQPYATAPGYPTTYPGNQPPAPQYAPSMPQQQPQISPYDSSQMYAAPAPAPLQGYAPASTAGASASMDTAIISGGTLGGAALLGGGGAIWARRRGQANQGQLNNSYSTQETFDEFGNPQPATPRTKLRRAEKDVGFGEIYYEPDENGNEQGKIKKASVLRRTLWSDREKLNYELKILQSRLELEENEKRSRGIKLVGIEDKLQEIEELRRKIALLPPDKNTSAYAPRNLSSPTYRRPSSLAQPQTVHTTSRLASPSRPAARQQPQSRGAARPIPARRYSRPMHARR